MLSIILRIAEVTQFISIEVLTAGVTRDNECDGPRCGRGIKSSVTGGGMILGGVIMRQLATLLVAAILVANSAAQVGYL